MRSFCPYDAVCSGFRVADRFRVYVRGHFAHTIETDPPTDSPPAPRRESTQNVARMPKSTWVGVTDRPSLGKARLPHVARQLDDRRTEEVVPFRSQHAVVSEAKVSIFQNAPLTRSRHTSTSALFKHVPYQLRNLKTACVLGAYLRQNRPN